MVARPLVVHATCHKEGRAGDNNGQGGRGDGQGGEGLVGVIAQIGEQQWLKVREGKRGLAKM